METDFEIIDMKDIANFTPHDWLSIKGGNQLTRRANRRTERHHSKLKYQRKT